MTQPTSTKKAQANTNELFAQIVAPLAADKPGSKLHAYWLKHFLAPEERKI